MGDAWWRGLTPTASGFTRLEGTRRMNRSSSRKTSASTTADRNSHSGRSSSAASGFLFTGLLMGFPEGSGRFLVAISYIFHDVFALIMLGGIFIHIYLSTIGQPGTFHAMTRGVVTRAWAWTHHPAWYREVTGRDPRADYEDARRRATKRARAIDAFERAEIDPRAGADEPRTE